MITFCFLKAQNFNISSERIYSNLYLKKADTSSNFHTSIKPFSERELGFLEGHLMNLDTIERSSILQKLTNNHLIEGGKNFKWNVNPILNAIAGFEEYDTLSQGLSELSLGLNLSMGLGKKWSAQLMGLWDNSRYPSHVDELVDEKNISPGYGFSKNNQSFFGQGNITYTADENFTFQLGYGKNFIGDGYRSLLLSDYANSYPYLKLIANIWKIKYMALYTNFQDIRGTQGNFSDFSQKLATIHYLSLNISKWWNIGFFESIIWQSQEGEFYRGYDINYVNPVIFLRPAEFSQGSSDNALLGGSMKFRLKKKNILYTQLILDEFKLDELKAGTGWWANKYGIQAGIRLHDFLWLKGLTFMTEYNIVRPFTYSYYYDPKNTVSTLQNYAHYNAPLAHPLGSNFEEYTVGFTYVKKRWILESLSTFARVGLDTNINFSIGQDVYEPYNHRENDYGYFTTDGLTTDISTSTLKLSYVLNPRAQLMLQLGVTNRIYQNSVERTASNFYFIGLKTAVINRYFDI